MKFITKTVDQLRNDANACMEGRDWLVSQANAEDVLAQRYISSRRQLRAAAKENEREAQRLRELANKLEREYK